MTQPINHIVIVGGGTAGWLTAATLAKQLKVTSNTNKKVTLVESPNIPILGVGEGTWPNLRATLKKIGVAEADFMRECDATFKQGALFVNWNVPKNGQTHRYYHPLNTVNHSSYDFSLAPYWLMNRTSQRYDYAVASQSHVCDANRGPKEMTTPEYMAVQEYSYHLNAGKFAAFLTKHCVEKLGVNHVLANVQEVELDAQEYIVKLHTDSDTAPTIDGDLFVDCSGSNPILIEKTYRIPWHDISDVIFNDTAIAIQVPYKSENVTIPSHTIMTAQDAGWIWDIALTNRRGVGHVFSSKYMTIESAEQTLRDYLGDDAKGCEARVIPLKLGYREKFWHKNCVAIGMSGGFVEPLEASAIFLFDAAANMLADQMPASREHMLYVENKFNRSFTMRMERTIEFIKLHYCISDRRDTAYWQDNCDLNSIPVNLQENLKVWKTRPPTRYDFEQAWEPFNLDSFLYVLYGLEFDTKIEASHPLIVDEHLAAKKMTAVAELSEKLVKHLPSHRDLLKKVQLHGFTRI
ncbi:tryptophan halogenase family protein [Pseudoalteromonas xiamenensis]|uniref:tryptophan halogenase family protein n=1 Tax=Pseudoalteromonas xiamenensis TaxID=882626 RepID=UPI0035E5EF16